MRWVNQAVSEPAPCPRRLTTLPASGEDRPHQDPPNYHPCGHFLAGVHAQ